MVLYILYIVKLGRKVVYTVEVEHLHVKLLKSRENIQFEVFQVLSSFN